MSEFRDTLHAYNNLAPSPTEDTRVREHKQHIAEQHKQTLRERFYAAGGLAILTAIAITGYNAVSEHTTETPVCAGSQEVTAISGDTVSSIKHKHIGVTDGYVDLSAVPAIIHRTELIHDNNFARTATVEVHDASKLRPGDEVIIPKTCNEG